MMIKEIPKDLIAEVPKNLRFYDFAGNTEGFVLVDISDDILENETGGFKPGDVVLSNECSGVLLGKNVIGRDCIVFYNDLEEKIEILLSSYDFSKLKKVGYIKL